MKQTDSEKSNQITGLQQTSSDEDWIKLGYEERRSSIVFLNDTAKLFLALPSSLSTLYLGLLAGISLVASKTLDYFSMTPVAAWVIAGIFAVLALFPRSYQVHPDSPSDIEQENKMSIKRKLFSLRISGVVFLIGLMLAAWRIFVLVNGRNPVELPTTL